MRVTTSAATIALAAAAVLALPASALAAPTRYEAESAPPSASARSTSSQPITLRSYNDERVIIDGENMPYTPGALDSSIPRADRGVIHIGDDWWRLVGLEIVNGPYGVFGLDVNNSVFERLVTRDNYESGLHLQGSSSNNLILRPGPT